MNKNSKNKYIVGWLLLVLLGFTYIPQAWAQTSVYGHFPYYQSFRTTVQPDEIEKVAPQGGRVNAATFTSEGLRLTPATTQQFGGIFIKDRQFRAKQGIRIEFEYLIYDGTGADGMSVFLFDASVQNPTIGAPGAGIGYAYNRANNNYNGSRASGLSGAYLGIALDSYGNFKQRFWEEKARVNGIPTSRIASNVTLRGARGGGAQDNLFSGIGGMGAGYTGYPVLISQPTTGGNQQGWILDEIGGGYSDIHTYQGDFDLRGGSQSYRKAVIELFPVHGDGGFLVTVRIQHGQSLTTVIDDYHYKTSLEYAENAYTIAGDYNNSNPMNPISTTSILDASVPEFLRIGFAASTGALTDVHLLRELKITLPGAAEAYNDYASTPMTVPVSIGVLDNDLGYNGPIIKDQAGSNILLDPDTFRFCDQAGIVMGEVEADYTVYTSGEGTWRFDFLTKMLTFTPAAHFVGQATIRYSIKAGLNGEIPYNDEAYRSVPATVTVDVIPPEAVISNKMITPVIIPQ